MMTKSDPTAKEDLPAEFLERLQTIVPAAQYDGVVRSFGTAKPVSFRINTLADGTAARARLRESGIGIEEVPWFPEAMVLSDPEQAPALEPLVEEGLIYRQALSSMLAALALGPRPGESVLDACAAPGSKTSLCAALMENSGKITAVERVRTRLYKLRAVLELQRVTNTETVLSDIRRYRHEHGPVDRALVDAPCSSEGRFHTGNPRSVNYWSLRKIREMRRKQRGILLSAGRLVKSGGTLIYATCTFAPEENEEVVDWFLRKTGGAFVLEDVSDEWGTRVESYPALKSWRKHEFHPSIGGCLRVLPTEHMDGFFIARLRKEEDT